jgi:hypothetical protein
VNVFNEENMKLVLELQTEAQKSNVSINDLLRKAYVVAVKLDVKEFSEWILSEQNGYGNRAFGEIPEYREVKGEIKSWHTSGFYQHVAFDQVEITKMLSQRRINQSISEIEHLLLNAEATGHLTVSYDAQTMKELRRVLGSDTKPELHIQHSMLKKILDAVQNRILNWSLQLEKDGILGEGMSFTSEELTKASRAESTYVTIINGGMHASQLQNGGQGNQQNNSVTLLTAELQNLITNIDTSAEMPEAQKELARAYAHILLGQAKANPVERDVTLIENTWSKLEKICTAYSLVEIVIKLAPYVAILCSHKS